MANCYRVKGIKHFGMCCYSIYKNTFPPPTYPLLNVSMRVTGGRMREWKMHKEAESELWLCLALQQCSQIGSNSPVLRVEHNPANALSPTESMPDSPVSGLSCTYIYRQHTYTHPLTFECTLAHQKQDLLLLFSKPTDFCRDVMSFKDFLSPVWGFPTLTGLWGSPCKLEEVSLLHYSLSHARTLWAYVLTGPVHSS